MSETITETLARGEARAGDVRAGRVPLFIERPHGRLFAVHHPPANGARPGAAVLYVPPFAEEMNQSRRMATLQAEALTEAGYGVLILDLTGCGDSTGELVEARWETWRDDVAAGCRWLEAEGYGPVTLWGLRLGAALAVEAASAEPGLCRRLVLWQPTVSGKTLLTQFLRLRVAANMGAGGETTKSLRADLASGRTLEIAGYELTPAMADALDAVNLADAELPGGLELVWIEVASDAGRGPSPAAARVIEAWRERGLAPAVETVAGEPFWSIQETTVVPALVERTVALMRPAAS